MTYNELRKALKELREQGLTSISLNEKKDVLLAEYERLTAIAVEAVESTIEEAQEIEATVVHPIEVAPIVSPSSPAAETVRLLAYSLVAYFWITCKVVYSLGRLFRWLADEAYSNGQFVGEWYFSRDRDRKLASLARPIHSFKELLRDRLEQRAIQIIGMG